MVELEFTELDVRQAAAAQFPDLFDPSGVPYPHVPGAKVILIMDGVRRALDTVRLSHAVRAVERQPVHEGDVVGELRRLADRVEGVMADAAEAKFRAKDEETDLRAKLADVTLHKDQAFVHIEELREHILKLERKNRVLEEAAKQREARPEASSDPAQELLNEMWSWVRSRM